MAKKISLAKVQKMQSNRLAAAARAKKAAKATVDKQLHSVVNGATAFGIGFAAKKKFALPTIDGIAPEVLYGGLALVASTFIKDKKAQRILDAVTDGLIGVAAYKAGVAGFDKLINYSPSTAAISGNEIGAYGEEIIETGSL